MVQLKEQFRQQARDLLFSDPLFDLVEIIASALEKSYILGKEEGWIEEQEKQYLPKESKL